MHHEYFALIYIATSTRTSALLQLLFLLLSFEFMADDLHNKVSEGVKNVANACDSVADVASSCGFGQKLISIQMPNKSTIAQTCDWTEANFGALSHRNIG